MSFHLKEHTKMVNIDRNAVSASSLLLGLQSKSKKDVNFNVTDVNLDEGLKTLHSKIKYLRTNFDVFFAKSCGTKMEYLRTNFDVFFAKSGGTKILGSSLDDAFTRNL